MAEPTVFSKNINTLLDEKSKGISTAEKKFMAGWDGIEKHIFKRVKEYSLKLGTTGGVLDFDPSNVEHVNGLSKVILDAIDTSEYPEKVKDYIRDFDVIKKTNMEIHGDVNGLSKKELEKAINPVQQQMVDQTITGLTGSGIDTEFIQPMKEGIMKNIVAGATMADLEKVIEGFIISNPARLGRLTNYSQQIARDTLNQFDGQINSRIATEFGLNAYRYVGSLIDDSRPQCIRWVRKEVLTKDELEAEINWANNNGSGMIPGTNPENFGTFRGGYNCRHAAIPFKLTKSQLEELGKREPDPPKPPDPPKDEYDIGLTESQKDLNLTFGQSAKVPDNLKYLNLPDQLFELSDNGSANIGAAGSHYDPFTKKVELGLNSQRAKAGPTYSPRVTIHEYAHRTHFNEKWFTLVMDEADPGHMKSFEDSVNLFNKKFSTRASKKAAGVDAVTMADVAKNFDISMLLDKYKGKIPGANERDVVELIVAYLDTIEALSRGKYGMGHGKKYFTQRAGAFRPMEWFAHASENYWFGNIVFKTEFPELYDQMMDYYKNRVVNEKLSKFKK